MAKQNKKVDQIRQLYHLADSSTRRQWQQINQKGYEFAHDEQLTQQEINSILELIYNEIDNQYGIENIDNELKKVLKKLQM